MRRSPPCVPCSQHGTAVECTGDASCQWLAPACGGTPTFTAGCFDARACTQDTDCASGATCEELSINPCADAPCTECAGSQMVCVG